MSSCLRACEFLTCIIVEIYSFVVYEVLCFIVSSRSALPFRSNIAVFLAILVIVCEII
jgi:hypothetical protein